MAAVLKKFVDFRFVPFMAGSHIFSLKHSCSRTTGALTANLASVRRRFLSHRTKLSEWPSLSSQLPQNAREHHASKW